MRSRIRPVVVGLLALATLVSGVGVAEAAGMSTSLPALQERIARLDHDVAGWKAMVASLQSKVDALSARIETATDSLDRLQAHVAWLEGARTLMPHGDPTATSGAIRRLRRERSRLAQAERAVAALTADASKNQWLPKLFEAQDLLAKAQAQRDAVVHQAALLGWEAGATSSGTGIGSLTYEGWARLLLGRMGAPACVNNLIAVVAWQAAERTGASWNPLATTLARPGSTSFNGAGVQSYRSLEEGLDATAATLWGGYASNGYGWIVYRLRQCADPQTTAASINASNWCRGCADGQYVLDLVADVAANYDRYAGR